MAMSKYETFDYACYCMLERLGMHVDMVLDLIAKLEKRIEKLEGKLT